MTIPATIYARFSSIEQSKGASLERQLGDARVFCQRVGWQIEDEIIDEGLSAFKGTNRAEGGELYAFEQRVKAGVFAEAKDADDNPCAGHVFVCEHLDRITRQGWEEAYGFVKTLTSNGVSVATTMDGKVFQAGQKVEMGDVMLIIVRSEVAVEESAKKQVRIIDAWKKRRAHARETGKALTTRCPGWLKVDPVTREFVPITDRVRTLRLMFKLSENGMGSPAIANHLNGIGREPFGGAKGGWSQAVVTMYLTDRRVLGEYQPMTRQRKPYRLEPNGDVVLDYYPAVIPTDRFNRVQAARAQRKQKGGRIGKTKANIFQGFVKCAHCGGRMTYTSTRKAGDVIRGQSGSRKPLTFVAKIGNSSLRCDNAIRKVRDGKGALVCENRASVRYEYLEPAVLDRLLHVAFDNRHFAVAERCASLSTDVAELERRIGDKGKRLAAAADSFVRTGMAVMEQMAANLDRELKEDRTALDCLRAELIREEGQVSPEEHVARVRDIRDAMNDSDADTRLQARIRVHQALSHIITRVECRNDRHSIVTLAHGLARLDIDAKGSVLDAKHRDGLRLYRKEYQLGGLRAVAGNAETIEAVVRRADRQKRSQRA